MSDTTFILASPSTTTLSQAASLNILPFSLGSNSNPYSTSTAPTNQYFQPRPAPANLPSIPQGSLITTFRGRQLVGQKLEVPRGYRGIILSTSRRPDQGGAEIRHEVDTASKAGGKGKGKAKEERWPLTPASSTVSVASTSTSTISGGRVTRRNANAQGQVALSKPKARQAMKKPVSTKRFRLDSDDESAGEQEEDVKPKTPIRTPSKRIRKGMIISPVKDPRLPAIVVQAPTPIKAPPVTRSSMVLDDEGVTEVMEDSVAADEDSQGSQVVGSDVEGNALELDLKVEDDIKEEIVPSPATEEDPPSFMVPEISDPISAVQDEVAVKEDREEKAELEGSIRILQPISTFDHITLWTPDRPLPGFRANELDKVKHEAEDTDEKEEQGHKGWWRTGGAGEGGDEMVRAMGEWLGLVEMVCFVSFAYMIKY